MTTEKENSLEKFEKKARIDKIKAKTPKPSAKKTTLKYSKKKKKASKAKKEAPERTTRLRPKERKTWYKMLIEHFGASKIDKALSGIEKVTHMDPVLRQWKKKMEMEIDQAEREVEEYYKIIDQEYKRVGRPKSIFNWKELEYLCSIGCTLDEVAGFFQMYKDTVRKKILEEYNMAWVVYSEQFSQGIKVSLRRAQIKTALDGDTSMQKFLGINILGQKQKIEFEGEVKVNSWVDLMNNIEPGENSVDPDDNKNENNNENKEELPSE